MSWNCTNCACSNPAETQLCTQCGQTFRRHTHKPKILQFGVSDSEIRIGYPTIFHWEVQDAISLEIRPGIGSVRGQSFTEVFLEKGGEYTLIAKNEVGREISSVSLSLPDPKIQRFEISSHLAELYDPVVLKWEANNASKVVISPEIGEVESSGECEVSPSQKTTYTLTATNGTSQQTEKVEVDILPPKVDYFKASTELITDKDPIELYWRVLNAHTVVLNHGIGKVPAQGSMKIKVVKPFDTYLLTAEGPSGKISQEVSLTVFPVPLKKEADSHHLEFSPAIVNEINKEVPEFFVENQKQSTWHLDDKILLEKPSIRRELRQVYKKVKYRLENLLEKNDWA